MATSSKEGFAPIDSPTEEDEVRLRIGELPVRVILREVALGLLGIALSAMWTFFGLSIIVVGTSAGKRSVDEPEMAHLLPPSRPRHSWTMRAR